MIFYRFLQNLVPYDLKKELAPFPIKNILFGVFNRVFKILLICSKKDSLLISLLSIKYFVLSKALLIELK